MRLFGTVLPCVGNYGGGWDTQHRGSSAYRLSLYESMGGSERSADSPGSCLNVKSPTRDSVPRHPPSTELLPLFQSRTSLLAPSQQNPHFTPLKSLNLVNFGPRKTASFLFGAARRSPSCQWSPASMWCEWGTRHWAENPDLIIKLSD